MSLIVVYDTMVFLQSLSQPHRVHATIRAVRERRVILALSIELLSEVRNVLSREQIRTKFPALTTEAIDAYTVELLDFGRLYDPIPQQFNWREHPDDNHVLTVTWRSMPRLVIW